MPSYDSLNKLLCISYLFDLIFALDKTTLHVVKHRVCVPLNAHVEVLTSPTSECDCTWGKGPERSHLVTMETLVGEPDPA